VVVKTVTVTAGGQTGVIPAGNITTNPSFEADTASWGTYQSTLARVTGTGLPDGAWFARLTRSAGTFFALDNVPNTVATAAANSTYQARAYLRAGSASAVGKVAVLRVREQSPAGELVSEYTGQVTLTNAFQAVTVLSTTRVGGDNLDITIGVLNAATGDALDVDAVSMIATAGGAGYDKPPAPSFTVTPAAPVVGQAVTFTDTSTDPDGAIAGRGWDLNGDGAFDDGTAASVQRTFTAAGTFTVREQVADGQGATSVAVQQVTVTTAPAQQPIPAGNLTTNPSFEANLTGWTGVASSLSREAVSGTPNGTTAVRVNRASGTTFGLDDNPNTVARNIVRAGDRYTAAAWVKSAVASSTGKQVQILIRERNSGGTIVRTSTASATLTATFQRIQVTATVQTANNSLDVLVQQTGAGAGNAFHADLVSMVKG
jgi:hypothetical protein